MDDYRRYVDRQLPLVERSCRSKAGFVTRAEARSLARGGLHGRGDLAPYRCGCCELWHLGHHRARHGRALSHSLGRVPEAASAFDGPEWFESAWWTARRIRHLRPATNEVRTLGAFARAA